MLAMLAMFATLAMLSAMAHHSAQISKRFIKVL
jgi:hypothetical protein